jgi:hypothetical protein
LVDGHFATNGERLAGRIARLCEIDPAEVEKILRHLVKS